MNIFVTDPAPVKCAQVLPDKHVVKMPLETCQMLAIVCSKKWGHNFGVLHKKMEHHTILIRVLFVITHVQFGQMKLFIMHGG